MIRRPPHNVLTILLFITEACPPTTKAMNENKDIRGGFKDVKRASKIQDDGDVDVLRSPDDPYLNLLMITALNENLTDHRIQIQMPEYTMVDNRLFLFS